MQQRSPPDHRDEELVAHGAGLERLVVVLTDQAVAQDSGLLVEKVGQLVGGEPDDVVVQVLLLHVAQGPMLANLLEVDDLDGLKALRVAGLGFGQDLGHGVFLLACSISHTPRARHC